MKSNIFLATIACLLGISLWMTACSKEPVGTSPDPQSLNTEDAGDRTETCNCSLSISANQAGNYGGNPWNLQMMYHNGTEWVVTAPPLISAGLYAFTIKKGTTQYYTFDALMPNKPVNVTATLRCSGNPNTPGSGCPNTFFGPVGQYTELYAQTTVSNSCSAQCPAVNE